MCWVLYGIVRVAMAVWLIFVNGTATVMFGALLNRVPDPFTLMSAFHFMYIAMIVLSVVCGVLGILAGLALFAGQRSGRTLAILAGVLSLSNIPLGTTLGIWTLVELLPIGPVQLYGRPRQTASPLS
jgi:hypothetical protein